MAKSNQIVKFKLKSGGRSRTMFGVVASENNFGVITIERRFPKRNKEKDIIDFLECCPRKWSTEFVLINKSDFEPIALKQDLHFGIWEEAAQ